MTHAFSDQCNTIRDLAPRDTSGDFFMYFISGYLERGSACGLPQPTMYACAHAYVAVASYHGYKKDGRRLWDGRWSLQWD